MTMNMNEFRTTLKATLKQRKMSVNALAKDKGLPQASLSRFLTGKTELHGKTLLSLLVFVYGDIFNVVQKDNHTPEAHKEQ